MTKIKNSKDDLLEFRYLDFEFVWGLGFGV